MSSNLDSTGNTSLGASTQVLLLSVDEKDNSAKPITAAVKKFQTTAFRLLDESTIEPHWMTAAQCETVTSKGKDLYIVPVFRGSVFDHLSQLKCRICGPMFVIDCLNGGQNLPKMKTPLYSKTFDGLHISLEKQQDAAEKEQQIAEKISWLGGIVAKRLLTDHCDYLVTDDVRSKKYKAASAHGIKVVTPQFVEDVWRRLDKGDVISRNDVATIAKKHAPLPLKGITITCSGLTQAERDSLSSKVLKLGGHFTKDMKREQNTHLVTDQTNSTKFIKANEWGLTVVKTTWVADITKTGYFIDETDYLTGGVPVIAPPTSTNKMEHHEVKAPQPQLTGVATDAAPCARKKATASTPNKNQPVPLPSSSLLDPNFSIIPQADFGIGGRLDNQQSCSYNASFLLPTSAPAPTTPLTPLTINADTVGETIIPPPSTSKSPRHTSGPTDMQGKRDGRSSNGNNNQVVVDGGSKSILRTAGSLKRVRSPSLNKSKTGVRTIDDFDLSVHPMGSGESLSRCRIFIVGLSGYRLEKAKRMINAGGGGREENLSSKVTHVVIGDEKIAPMVFSALTELKCGSMTDLEHCEVVTVEWLICSFEQDTTLSCDRFRHPQWSRIPPVVTEERSPNTSIASSCKRFKEQLSLASPKNNAVPVTIVEQPMLDETVDDMALLAAAEAVEQAADEANKRKTLNNKSADDNANDALTKGKSMEVLNDGGSCNTGATVYPNATDQAQQPQQVVGEAEASDLFVGLTFACDPFWTDEAELIELHKCITNNGGELVSGVDSPADILIVPPNVTDVMWDRIQSNKHNYGGIYTLTWLQSCVDEGTVLEMGSNKMFTPLVLNEAQRRLLTGLAVCISGFVGSSREFVLDLLSMVGAIAQETMCRHDNQLKNARASTHLLVNTDNFSVKNSKYIAASKWGLSVVSLRWLYDSIEQGVVLPVENIFESMDSRVADQQHGITPTPHRNAPTTPLESRTLAAANDTPKVSHSADTAQPAVAPRSGDALPPRCTSTPLNPRIMALKSGPRNSRGSAESPMDISPAPASSDTPGKFLDPNRTFHPNFDLRDAKAFVGDTPPVAQRTSPVEGFNDSDGSMSESHIGRQLQKAVENTSKAPFCGGTAVGRKTSLELKESTAIRSTPTNRRSFRNKTHSDSISSIPALEMKDVKKQNEPMEPSPNSTKEDDGRVARRSELASRIANTLKEQSSTRRSTSCPHETEATTDVATPISRTADPLTNTTVDADLIANSGTRRTTRLSSRLTTEGRTDAPSEGAEVQLNSAANADSLLQPTMPLAAPSWHDDQPPVQSPTKHSAPQPNAQRNDDHPERIQDDAVAGDASVVIELTGVKTPQSAAKSDSMSTNLPNTRASGKKKADGSVLSENRVSVTTKPSVTEPSTEKDEVKESRGGCVSPVIRPSGCFTSAIASDRKTADRTPANSTSRLPPLSTSRLHSATSSALLPAVEAQRCFLFTNVSLNVKTELSKIVKQLGGYLCEAKNWDNTCTHLITKEPSRNEKLMACMAAGKWALHTSYLEDSQNAGHFLNEEAYEWGSDSLSIGRQMTEGGLAAQLAVACRRWRMTIAAQAAVTDTPSKRSVNRHRHGGHKAGAFVGWRVLLLVRKTTLGGFQRLLEAGGADCVRVDVPESGVRSGDFTLALIDGEVDVKQIRRLASSGVVCCRVDYLAGYMTDGSDRCNVADYYIPAYKECLDKLKKRAHH